MQFIQEDGSPPHGVYSVSVELRMHVHLAPIRLSPKEIIDRNIFVGLPSKHGHILFAATTSDLLAFFRLFCHCFHARVGLLFAPQLFPTDQ